MLSQNSNCPGCKKNGVMAPSCKYVDDVAEGKGANSQRCLACDKPWADSIQEFELAHGPLSRFQSSTGHLPEAAPAASPFAVAPEPAGSQAGGRWNRGSPFAPKAADLPKTILDKVPVLWQSAFTGSIETTLPQPQADAVSAAVEKAAKDGSAEARSFTAALLEAKAFMGPKILPPPT